MAQLDRSLIAGSPTFANLSPAALDEILSHASTLRVPKGEAAFRQGEAADRFFLLLHGRLRVTRLNPQGQQMVVRFISPGDMFGVAMAIRRGRLSGYGDGGGGFAGARLAQFGLGRLAGAFSGAGGQYDAGAGRPLAGFAEAHPRSIDSAGRTAHRRRRVATGAAGGAKTEDGLLIDFPLSRQDLAEMIGTTLHTVSRTLSAWEERGLVEVSAASASSCATSKDCSRWQKSRNRISGRACRSRNVFDPQK